MCKTIKRIISFVLALVTVLALIPLGYTEAATMKQGSQGSQVKLLQQNLIGLGYLEGEADGSYGNRTKAAVQAFQADYGLSADGSAGNATQTALRNAVVRLQAELKTLGCVPGSADGHFGSKTSSAVKTFQSWLGLKTSGIAGSVVRSQIDSRSVGMVSGSAVRKGSSGTQVRYLQQALIGLGFLSGTADGQYGPATAEAVRKYQKAYGLSADGSAGPDTMTSLKNTVAALQSDLKSKGWYTGSIDGVFGSGTKAAVKAYQSYVGVSATGVAGPKTMAKLYGYSLGGSDSGDTGAGTDKSYKIWIDSLFQDGDYSRIWYDKANDVYKTVETSGCAGVAVAMAVNALQSKVRCTGKSVMDWFVDHGYYYGQGTVHEGLLRFPQSQGLNSTYCNSGKKLIEHLKRSRLAVVLVRDITGEDLFNSSSTTGHYVLVSGYRVKDCVDQVFVNNPLSNKSSRWFDLDDLLDNTVFRADFAPIIVIYQ